eukprot:GHVQ01001868.1.p1 GENE.GHVQ01001868.1~~GHVQ01001868.1.p1  ORF type:complete len:387 (+),score=58.10 GHVQ01001868.1:461-1621(+)
MVATYQLNKEQLSYNLQVLTERNKEHSAILLTYKNRLSRLREILNNLIGRYHKLDAKYRHSNEGLTEEYKRLTIQFKELQEKFKHFEFADENRFRLIWEVNENQVRQYMAKVLDADKIIHEQQLGLTWAPPREEELTNECEAFSESGTTTVKSTSKVSEDSGVYKRRYSPSKIKKVLDFVSSECHFLLDYKIKEELIGMDSEQQTLVQVDAILKYVGVENQDDIDLLVSLFYQGQDEDDETVYVDADDVLKLVKDFLREKENARIADVSPDIKKKKSGRQIGSETETDVRARKRREERRFWERMSHVLPDVNMRLWKALEEFLRRYYKELKDRSEVIDGAVKLQQENQELKQLMDQYLQSNVNTDLLVPPTHVIRVAPNPALSTAG